MVFIVDDRNGCLSAQHVEGLNEELAAILETALLHAASVICSR